MEANGLMDDKLWSKALLDSIKAREDWVYDDATKTWLRWVPERYQPRVTRLSRLWTWLDVQVGVLRYRLGMWIIPEDMRCYYD